ncbi:Polysaccharide deacetylase [uncultured Gammaproteobacteria bacterium]
MSEDIFLERLRRELGELGEDLPPGMTKRRADVGAGGKLSVWLSDLRDRMARVPFLVGLKLPHIPLPPVVVATVAKLAPVVVPVVVAGALGWWMVSGQEETVRRLAAEVPSVEVAITGGAPPGGAPVEAGAGGGAVTPPVTAAGNGASVASEPTSPSRVVDPPPPAPTPALVRGRVAIVISEMGKSGAATNLVLDRLPAAVTLAFVPYAERLDLWLETAKRQNHEVLWSLPMEPIDFPREDPGPNSLLTMISKERNLERLLAALGKANGPVGVTTLTGSRFLADAAALRPVLEALKARNYVFLDSGIAGAGAAAAVADQVKVVWARANRILDLDPSRSAIDQQLQELENAARAEGVAIAIGQPYPSTIERLSQWLPTLRDKRLDLVPLSAITGVQKPITPGPPVVHPKPPPPPPPPPSEADAKKAKPSKDAKHGGGGGHGGGH